MYTDVLENTSDVSKYTLKIHRCIQIYIDVLEKTSNVSEYTLMY